MVVNTARGELVDVDALTAALAGGRLAGAGLDVFATEPLEADSPLRTAQNLLLGPHAAWCSVDALPALQAGAAREHRAVLRHRLCHLPDRRPSVRIARLDTPGGPRLAAAVGSQYLLLDTPATDVAELARAGATQVGVTDSAVSGAVLAPIRPGKIVCAGLNYLDHVRETGLALPDEPLLFAKFPSSVIGPEDDIVVDATLTERVDWEVELAVVFGRRARNVTPDAAPEFVFGYTAANDVSARDLQFRDGQWVRGKSLDTFCPLGPVVVTADEILDPQRIGLRTRVNGEVVQDSSTAEMIFDVATLISYCSRSFTFEPGDVLLTGTPWGCGEFMDPKRSLHPGDLVEAEVDGIGTLRNRVRAPF